MAGDTLRLGVVLVVATIGTVFMLISAVGVLRLPDAYTRMHAAGKAATLGVSGLLLSTGLFFIHEGQLLRMIALIALFFVTSPIATTSMARAAYRHRRSRRRLQLRHDEMRESSTEE